MKFYRYSVFHLICLLATGCLAWPTAVLAEDIYGPVDLLKTFPTPFGQAGKQAGAIPDVNPFRNPAQATTGGGLDALAQAANARSSSGYPGQTEPDSVISIAPRAALPHRSLSDRLVQSRLYLPGRLVIGRTAEFTIKGRPGYFAALAMADKDAGAKPIYGRTLRLGPDRKVVSVGQIPDDGILHLVIDTPIEGDLIGQPLFFESALWSHPDFSDIEIAAPVTSDGQVPVKNGVIVQAEPDEKRGIKFKPDATMPSLQIANPGSGVDTGRP